METQRALTLCELSLEETRCEVWLLDSEGVEVGGELLEHLELLISLQGVTGARGVNRKEEFLKLAEVFGLWVEQVVVCH